LPEKTTDLTLYVEVDGEELEESASVEKHLPETYVREILVDGEIEQWEAWVARVTENANPDLYSSPYQFDTQNFTFEEFYEGRGEEIEEISDSSALEKGRQLDFSGLSKQEKIAKVSDHTNNEISGASAAAQQKAYTMEAILRRDTDLEEPIIAGGFENPGADGTSTGNHGSQMIHVDGDNYHSETANWPEEAARHVDNIDEVRMKTSTGNFGDYVSVLGELSPEFEQVSSRTGINRVNRMITGFTYPGTLRDVASYDDRSNAFEVRDMITENKFEEVLLGEMTAVQHGKETGRHSVLVNTGDNAYAISVKDEEGERNDTARELRRRIMEEGLEGRELMDELSEWEEVF